MGPYYIYGYHATDIQTVSRILYEKHVKQSTNWHDWLGEGSYFYQEAPLRALKWLTQERHEGVIDPSNAGLLCAKIKIENFVDLLEPDWVKFIAETYTRLKQTSEEEHKLLELKKRQPKFEVGGKASAHPLDKYVVDIAVEADTKGGSKDKGAKGVRAIFYDGDPIFDGSHLLDRQHIQIAILDWSVVEGLWPIDCKPYISRL